MFISFEGVEGSGKSTQIGLWRTYLESQGHTVTVTREPGGTPFGQHIRSLLLDPKTTLADARTELLLFTADRLEHIATCIQPALDQGHVVLCDRFVDSTYAYQLAGRKNTSELVDFLADQLPLMPQTTILFDLPVDVGLSRAKSRAALDRFEQEDRAFHDAIRQHYLARATAEPNRFVVVNCDGLSSDAVFQKTRAQVKL